MKTLETWKTVSVIALLMSIAVMFIATLALIWSVNAIWLNVLLSAVLLLLASWISTWLAQEVYERINKLKQDGKAN
jgi:L-asparagine transporter-like permease